MCVTSITSALSSSFPAPERELQGWGLSPCQADARCTMLPGLLYPLLPSLRTPLSPPAAPFLSDGQHGPQMSDLLLDLRLHG